MRLRIIFATGLRSMMMVSQTIPAMAPVISAIQEGNLLSLDNFSTYRDGNPYGNQRFVFVDTIAKTWQFA
ncbi:MAG: hypothetical protein J6I76_13895 [Oribacterium sp.]|nr:hypothetical protein [Oribacterium sp.]